MSALFTSSLSVAVSSVYCIWEIREKIPLIHFSCINMKTKVVSLMHLHFELLYKAVLTYVNDASRIDSTDEFIFEFLLNWTFFLHIFREFLLIIMNVIYTFIGTDLWCLLFKKGTQLLHCLLNCFEQCTFGFLSNFNGTFCQFQLLPLILTLRDLKMQGQVSD